MNHPGTPLAQTLGLKPGMRCWFHNMPGAVRAAIDPDRAQIEEQPTPSDGLQCAHLFVADRAQLERELAALRPLLAPNGFVWVSWQNETDISEAAVRAIAQPHGLADSAACAVDASWVALKLTIRRESH
jgi:hypothetical protein